MKIEMWQYCEALTRTCFVIQLKRSIFESIYKIKMPTQTVQGGGGHQKRIFP